MDKPKQKQYETERGIDGLFRNLTECSSNNYDLAKCIDIAIERGWQTPDPTYFEKNPPMRIFKNESATDLNKRLEEAIS